MQKLAGVAVAVGLFSLAACGGDDGSSSLATHAGESCVAGQVAICECPGGGTAWQACGATLVYDACPCPTISGVNGAGAGTTANNGFAGTGAGTFGATAGTFGATAGTFGATAGTFSTTAGVSGGIAGDGATAGVGAEAGSGAAGTGVTTGGDEPKIPATTESCPTLKTGNVTILGHQVQLFVGTKQTDKKGAIFFYWHGTGSNSAEARLMGPALDEIVAEGGIVASFTDTTGKGTTTGNNVWYTGDFEMADVIVKCAVEQLNIDTRRIYTGGCSAGGLQAGAMVYGRSSYLAGAMPNSGGVTFPGTLQDPSNVPAVITAHGTTAKDNVGIAFATSSLRQCNDIAAKGGMAVDCEHAAGHCQSPSDLTAAQWTFLKNHPFGVTPEPYETGLPSGFPSYCKIIE